MPRPPLVSNVYQRRVAHRCVSATARQYTASSPHSSPAQTAVAFKTCEVAAAAATPRKVSLIDSAIRVPTSSPPTAPTRTAAPIGAQLTHLPGDDDAGGARVPTGIGVADERLPPPAGPAFSQGGAPG
mmetsp:Transcript_6953/g.21288  ORF Transcript_6953/g.21288 Transcript_6953/m.21288 type:complete len:128 (+) Transcript_6953:636-1019(+)|eukprot:scaffold263924_cov31-Tisochrysis_lutea.AAC.3